MASVYRREGSKFLWGKYKDATGKVRRLSLGTEDEAVAQAKVNGMEREAREPEAKGEAPAALPGVLTVEGFARGEWLSMRKVSKPLAWKGDLSRMHHHFLPQFGKRALSWLETDDGGRAVFSWAVGLKTHNAKRDGTPIASRTVCNVYSSVKVMLDDAVEMRRLARSPLKDFRTDKYLPDKTDKDPNWRKGAGFDLEQVMALCTSPRLREHRRVWNTLAFFTGGRTGEIANLRWKDRTEHYKGNLGKLEIATSWNTASKVEKPTKTNVTKIVPIHPFADRVLRAWHETGFEGWMGRAPTPEDLIVPRADGRQWGNGQLLDYFHQDLVALGMRQQRQYENRSTFRMLLLNAGADEFLINRLTHPSPKQASDFYDRPEKIWRVLCEAILKLDLSGHSVPQEGQVQTSAGHSAESENTGCTGLEPVRAPVALSLVSPLEPEPRMARPVLLGFGAYCVQR